MKRRWGGYEEGIKANMEEMMREKFGGYEEDMRRI